MLSSERCKMQEGIIGTTVVHENQFERMLRKCCAEHTSDLIVRNINGFAFVIYRNHHRQHHRSPLRRDLRGPSNELAERRLRWNIVSVPYATEHTCRDAKRHSPRCNIIDYDSTGADKDPLANLYFGRYSGSRADERVR